MSTLHREILIDAPAAAVWDAVRDVGRPDVRLAPGFVTDATFDGHVRTITFKGGHVAREHIVTVDEERQRVAYAILDGTFEHYHGTMQVVPAEDESCRLDWTIDLRPEEAAPVVAALFEEGVSTMQRTLRG